MTADLPQRTQCCIAGGGPAGVMLGYLLARAGIDVVVLEKHRDFLRDFRGDTIHPSTLTVLDELGLLDAFLALPHDEVRELGARVGGVELPIADFTHVPGRCKFLALVPQWDFLNFLVDAGRRFAGFDVRMNAEVVGLERSGERVTGVRVRSEGGEYTIAADLVVGADGRASTVRAAAGLVPRDLGAPIDVLWMRIERRDGDPGQAFGIVEAGRVLVLIVRRGYYQAGLVIPKGDGARLRERGIDAFRAELVALAPFLAGRLDALTFDDVRTLEVRVDRLEQWDRPGLLCIGDAAHAMSPIGGVGINLAIQDAVATANLLAECLRRGAPSERDVRAVQRRRALPAILTQSFQVFIHRRVLARVLGARARIVPPWPLRLFLRVPALRRLAARAVGIGVRPEHVRSRRA